MTIDIPETQRLPVDQLKADGKNPNKMTKKEFSALKANFKRYGFLVPIITNKNFLIADGEHRWRAARELGMKEVPVVVLDVDEVDRRILRQVMNKLRGEHDKEGDLIEFQYLMESDSLGLLADLMSESEKELLTFLDDGRSVPMDDFDLDSHLKNPKHKLKHGEVWQLGVHRIMCGDSTSKDDVEGLMDGKNARMTFTDPPYNVDYGSSKKNNHRMRIKNDKQTSAQWESFCKRFIANIKRYTTGDVYVWGASGPDGVKARLLLSEAGCHWSATIIWKKHQLILTPAKYQRIYEPCFYGWFEKSSYRGGRKQTEVWEIDRPTDSKLHPTMKPLELCSRAIKNSSIRQDLILDLFGGSGSTLIACEDSHRTCYMMEIDPAYCSVIIERWEEFTGKKAHKVNQ